MIGSLIAIFFGGMFFVNALPHFVAGVQGRKFPTPFGKPSGIGESSALVNVIWGAFNFGVAYLLLCEVGAFDLRSPMQFMIAAAGGLAIAVFSAQHFGQVSG